MSLLKNRYNYIKLYRPKGAPYADGEGKTPELAVAAAMVAFEEEFKRPVQQNKAFIEILGATAVWVSTVFEIDDMV